MAEPSELNSLQFDKAEYITAPSEQMRCVNCSQPLVDEYYQVGGRVTCRNCRDAVEATLTASAGGGRRFFRATLFGMLAAAVGSAIWYAVLALAHMELGLIAILVGLMVGGAVRHGSNGRGGWRYQLLAILLTYGSIASTYMPFAWRGLKEGIQKQQALNQQESRRALPDGRASETVAPVKPSAIDNRSPAVKMAIGILALIALGIFLFVIACAFPFLGGIKNIMGIIIIGIALYEAWKINRRMPIQIAGPFRVGAGPVPPAIHA